MTDPNTYYLLPSQIFVAKSYYNVVTVLGSCVSICLWDNVNKIGGMNHFMLPLWNGNGLATPKFGNIATEKLIEKMIKDGSQLRYMNAKVFGGGDVLSTESKIFNIGQRNIEIAEKLLSELKIPIIANSVGGKQGRKIMFNTNDGTVKQKYVASTCSPNFINHNTLDK